MQKQIFLTQLSSIFLTTKLKYQYSQKTKTMKSKAIIVFVILLGASSFLTGQIIPKCTASFTKVELWEREGQNVFGKLADTRLASTKIEIFASENYTYIEINSSFFSGKGAVYVKTAKEFPSDDGSIGYLIDGITISDNRSEIRLIVEYDPNKQLTSLSSFPSDEEYVFKFK